MGIKFKEFVAPVKKTIEYNYLTDKIIGIDIFNYLYAYLIKAKYSSGLDITYQGKKTIHVNVLFYKIIDMLLAGIKPVFVFDGTDKIKQKMFVLEQRRKTREKAAKEAEEAKERGDVVNYNKKVAMTLKIEPYMIQDTKALVEAFGLPVVDARYDGESQLAYMVKNNDIYASITQDYDALLFGSDIVIRNFLTGKSRDLPIEKICLNDLLNHYNITMEQMVDIAILNGTDFNYGVFGIGVKTALKYILKYGNIIKVYEKVKSVNESSSLENFLEIRDIFLKPEVNTEYKIKFNKPVFEDIEYVLICDCGFNPERVDKGLDRLKGIDSKRKVLLQKQHKKMF